MPANYCFAVRPALNISSKKPPIVRSIRGK
jgi:hypothetical protein